MSATLPCRPVESARATWLGTYPNLSATALTRRTVSSLSISGRVKARDTVARETPEIFAT